MIVLLLLLIIIIIVYTPTVVDVPAVYRCTYIAFSKRTRALLLQNASVM